MQIQKLFAPAILLALVFVSCKKEDSASTQPQPQPPATGNVNPADRWKDTALAYTRDIYLWYKQIPANFNAKDYADQAALMAAIRNYSTEPGFSAPVDRWSFAINKQEWDNLSGGVSEDFGLNIFFLREGDLRVRAVERRSSAGMAGVKRGWQITKINGNTNMTTNNADFIVQNIYNSKSAAVTFKKPDGTSVDLNLNASSYQEDPVYLDSVYTINSKKVGYLVFNSFLGDTAQVYSAFNRAFSNFSSQGVQDLVVDLRYNGGGYVSVAEKLANYLVPSSGNGGVMLTQKFNDKYSAWNETARFQKMGSLNLNRIFFIVSGSTASASELLINSLKPYMNVLLLGERDTHGKPVGYFPIPVDSWYILPVSFLTVNKDGVGNYYNGLAVNNKVADGLDKNWGDVTEISFASALKYIQTGSFRTSAPGEVSRSFEQNPAVISGNTKLDAPNFKGAIDTRGLK